MSEHCIIPCCSSKFSKGKGNVSFHEFPYKPEIRKLWIEHTGRPNWTPNEKARVCALHFSKECFKPGLQKRSLLPTAVPTLFPGNPDKVRFEMENTWKNRRCYNIPNWERIKSKAKARETGEPYVEPPVKKKKSVFVQLPSYREEITLKIPRKTYSRLKVQLKDDRKENESLSNSNEGGNNLIVAEKTENVNENNLMPNIENEAFPAEFTVCEELSSSNKKEENSKIQKNTYSRLKSRSKDSQTNDECLPNSKKDENILNVIERIDIKVEDLPSVSSVNEEFSSSNIEKNNSKIEKTTSSILKSLLTESRKENECLSQSDEDGNILNSAERIDIETEGGSLPSSNKEENSMILNKKYSRLKLELRDIRKESSYLFRINKKDSDSRVSRHKTAKLKLQLENLKKENENLKKQLNSNLYVQIRDIKKNEKKDQKAQFLIDQVESYGKEVSSWSEETIRRCILWYARSSSAYTFAETILSIPSYSSLKRFMGNIDGITEEILHNLFD